MKLRITPEAVRLRLRRGDVDTLLETGFVEKRIQTGPAATDCLSYRLQVGAQVQEAQLVHEASTLSVGIPLVAAREWAESEAVGLYFQTPWGVRLMIEKDFGCLERQPAESEIGTFPRPSKSRTPATPLNSAPAQSRG